MLPSFLPSLHIAGQCSEPVGGADPQKPVDADQRKGEVRCCCCSESGATFYTVAGNSALDAVEGKKTV